jgi:hypothetical protein
VDCFFGHPFRRLPAALRRANDIGQDHAGVWASPDPQDVSLSVLRSRGDAGSPAGGSAAERRGDATFVGSPKPLALTRMSSGERCIRRAIAASVSDVGQTRRSNSSSASLQGVVSGLRGMSAGKCATGRGVPRTTGRH